jgi:hypothetical protein
MTQNTSFLEIHKETLDGMYSLTCSKNRTYGSSIEMTHQKYGIVAMLVRMEDKMNRLMTLHTKNAPENDEAFEDTLTDLANYASLAVTLCKIYGREVE